MNDLSKAKEQYYSEGYREGCDFREDAQNYIEELEKNNLELIELVKRICIANGINSEHVFEDFYEKLKSQNGN